MKNSPSAIQKFALFGIALIFMLSLIDCNAEEFRTPGEVVILGKWSEAELSRIIKESAEISDAGGRIGFISERFLGTPYGEATLIGNARTEEAFVVNLEAVDCFTYIDYVEAMSRADALEGFKGELRRVRYRGGDVSFQARNHFFTDWREFNKERVEDVTARIGGRKTVTVMKTLNKKSDGGVFLPGIAPTKREIAYIPAEVINSAMLKLLKTGDFVGIYSRIQGLDVSHTGIIVKRGDRVYLRHASSKPSARAVVDEGLVEYLRGKPGIVVLRGR